MYRSMAKIYFSLKQAYYPLMRQIAIGMTSTYLPPVVPRKTITENPGSQTPISFDLKNGKRFAWNRQIVRQAH